VFNELCASRAIASRCASCCKLSGTASLTGVALVFPGAAAAVFDFVTAVAATALLGAVSVAFAADATGKIKNVDMNKDMIKLDNGSSYIVPKSVKLSDFKVGEKVTVIYNKTGNKFDVTSIRPAT